MTSKAKESFLQASSAGDLLKQLEAVDISVPPRGQGRKSEDCERHSICRFLAAIAGSPILKFPLQLTKREAPDYLLELPGEKIGIEVTEAIPPDQAEISSRREKIGGKGSSTEFVWAHQFEPGSRKNKREKELIARGRPSDGWAGDEPERYWTEWMLRAYNNKARKEYSGAASYWLLIYDNLLVPNVDISKAIELLTAGLLRKPDSSHLFERVCIESKGRIWICQGSTVASFEIPSLWKSPV